MVPQQRPLMPVHIFNAIIKGNTDYLVQCLGLLEEREEIKVTIGSSQFAPQQTEKHENVQFVLGSATRFGDTLLHLFITGRHNELALKVFTKDMSLLKARNKKLETPLHNAAKVGNEEVIRDLIRLSPNVVKDALGETNENGDTTLHVAANHNHLQGVISELMKLEPQTAYEENKQGFSPLYIAIVKGHNSLVEVMLQVDTTLACIQFPDGTFPVQVAARRGNADLVKHFLQEYPDYAKLLDSCGRNLFHMLAEQNRSIVFTEVFALTKDDSRPHISQMIESMINARDYEGNTPLHMAAMKEDRHVMRAIWDKLNHDREALLENQMGKTAFEISFRQLWDANEDSRLQIKAYIEKKGWYFTRDWFDYVMSPYPNKLERSQLIGLGSVLITTVAFAAAFAIPGGYNADNGAPILGKRFMFRAFILANTFAFIQAFQSLFIIVHSSLDYDIEDLHLEYAVYKFLSAASCMVIAFGLGSYVMLAPVSLPIAIIILVVTLLIGSPALFPVIMMEKSLVKRFNSSIADTTYNIPYMIGILTMPMILIFCLPVLSLL
ncbi:hypothetical protein LUZ63_013544 [Rhynchospora breviuscula]|uniref:PGG domain-containing protein n=1 Tax=Rhynchospora breviuscula TaxID=2022672 RepID=A0A9Q0C931_9POAL|nr:hypothetical protein LUZ63_013544 [Rhynchospora breviuscula]